jgi:hypothetical protein
LIASLKISFSLFRWLVKAGSLIDAKVRLFGDVFAMAYGNERSNSKLQGQPEALRCLVWTDTWLKRDGKWEVIAAQDTAVPRKSAR